MLLARVRPCKAHTARGAGPWLPGQRLCLEPLWFITCCGSQKPSASFQRAAASMCCDNSPNKQQMIGEGRDNIIAAVYAGAANFTVCQGVKYTEALTEQPPSRGVAGDAMER